MIGKTFSQFSSVAHEIDATYIDQMSSRADYTVATPRSLPSEALMDFHPSRYLQDRVTATIPSHLHTVRQSSSTQVTIGSQQLQELNAPL